MVLAIRCGDQFTSSGLLGATAAGSANPVQTINTANSIVGRAVALIKHLAGAEPHRGWSQFLTAAGKFKWSQITVAGHSRGSSYPPLVSKYFPARRVISVGGVADHWGAANQTNASQFAPKWLSRPAVMPAEDIYALNPGFEGTIPKSVDYYALANGTTGNATFTRSIAASPGLEAQLGGARLLWDAEICANTTSPHMCIGTCDGWQPVDRSNRPLLAPVWKYLLLNTDPPSAKALGTQVHDTIPQWTPPVCSASGGTELPRAGRDSDLVGGYHRLDREQSPPGPARAAGDCFHDPRMCPSCAKTGCKNCGAWGEKGCAPCEPEPEPRHG